MDGSIGDLLLSLIPLGIAGLYPLLNEKARTIIRTLRRPHSSSKIVVEDDHTSIVEAEPPKASAT